MQCTLWPQVYYNITSSTEDAAQQWLPHVSEGVGVYAGQQTTGRGRQGRVWHSAGGNLTASLWGKSLPTDGQFWPFFWAVVVHEVLSVWRVDVSQMLHIKWPNDILCGHNKVAGILLTQTAQALGMGLGINLRVAPLPHTTVIPVRCTPYALWQHIISHAQQVYALYWHNRSALHAQWLQRALPLGTLLHVRDGTTHIAGAFAGLHPHGALRLHLPTGEERLFYAADAVEMGNPC